LEESVQYRNHIRGLVFLGILFVLTIVPLSAQNSVPNPNESSCWDSVSALRACAEQQYKRELDYEQRCTSYPEYQCAPAREQNVTPAKKPKNAAKPKSEQASVAVTQPSASDSMAATATSQPIDAK
jgi:hypothetical protein